MIMEMKVFVFGNQDSASDNIAILAAEKLEGEVDGVEFLVLAPNEDLPFASRERVVLMDVVSGTQKVMLIEGGRLERLKLSPRNSVHDFDLGFQLKYLAKLGRLGEVKVIGLPMGKEPDYLRIKSILRKLVAQDMQGS